MSPRSKLTLKQVATIRHAFHVLRKSASSLAARFKVGISTIYNAVRGTSYREVPMQDGKYATPERVAARSRTKISQVVVDSIRLSARIGLSKTQVARKYGVSPQYVHAILTGKFRARVAR